MGVSIFLVHYRVTGQAVYGDGIGYFAHLHSWIIDQDWDYTNEYEHNYSPQNNNSFNPTQADAVQIVATNGQGRAENHYSPGTAVLLLPAYMVAHALSLILRLPTAGYSDLYQISSGVAAVGFTVAGLFILEKFLRLFISDTRITRLTTITVFLGTHLVYYGSFDVINSHFASFFLTSVFFYHLFTLKPSPRNDLILGGLVGLMACVRLQDASAAVVWLLYRPKYWYAFVTGITISLIPMFYQWTKVFDTILQHRYLVNFLSDSQKHVPIDLVGSWFNTTTGLFFRSPVLLLGFAGLIINQIKLRDKRIWLIIAYFAIQTLIIVVQRGWPASAYGGRMYTSSLIPLAGLLAIFLGKLKYNHARVLSGTFIVLSLVSVFHFVLLEKNTQDGGRGTEIKTLQRILTP